MGHNDVSRRQASKILLAGGLATAAGLSTALGQPSNKPPGKPAPPPSKPSNNSNPSNSPKPATPAAVSPAKSVLEDVLKRGKTHDWILKPTIHVQAYQQDTARSPKDKPLTIGALKFSTAAVVFPVLRGTSSSEVDIDNVKSQLTFNDRVEDTTPQYNESYHSGVRLGRWELRDREGKEVELKLEIPMTCWETIIDEKLAAKATWPSAAGAGGSGSLKWPAAAQSTFGRQAMIDSEAEDARALTDLVGKWTEGKSPQSISPYLLAKTFAGKAVKQFQPNGNGEDYDEHGSFTGLVLQGPHKTIATGQGSPHDITSVLVGAYRAAGLPARLVVGWDEEERKGDDSNALTRKRGGGGMRLRSWAEFCLFDEAANKEVWIPADVVRMRKRSTQVANLEAPWKYFGSHEEMDAVLPFAFHFTPPTTVFSYGYAFWGWFTTPTTQLGEHWLRFNTQTAPRRAKPKEQPGGKNK